MRHTSICEFCGIIGHIIDACVICGPKLLPPMWNQTPAKDYALWINGLPYHNYLPVNEGIDKEWENQSFCCAKDDRSHHLTWQQRKICYLYGRRRSWYLPLSRDDWSSNHIYQFRSSLSSFRPFIFQQKLCSGSAAIYCCSPHETEKYLWILWKIWTQSWCMNHPWSKITPAKS